MIMNPKLVLASLMATIVPAGLAGAAIVYVDAAHGPTGNTFETGGSLADTSWLVTKNNSTADNDDWDLRSGATIGNSGTALQANVSVVGSTPQLTTQITSLANGTYDIWVFFWDPIANNQWNIDAGLSPSSLTTYSVDGAGVTSSTVQASTLSFSTTVMTTGGGGELWGVKLGSVAVSGGTVNVYVDKSVGTTAGTRTFYDGVGYELVPEPTSFAMMGLGGLCLLKRRRREA